MSSKKGKAQEELGSIILPVVTEMGYELVDIQYGREGSKWILRIFIDHPEGIGLDDCEMVSRQVEKRLDEEDPIPHSYVLEVSSPGIERPLKLPHDYERFKGRLATIKTYGPVDGRRKFTGTLQGLKDDQVIITENGKNISIPLEMVSRAHLTIEF
ncbi:ribosome maturation factor RimP [Calderihabitans maritimus]|uniref:Ribosome maturation factor RimP n=1 Tax=Calderihabitans maritimus TaxID=1246530 RepID=A0A1Z5HY63_9FIRM|nr:ribosome maturation factor RimP [Calderihabitans maritimus]GAW94307.1 hypothetical protein Moth_1046 [Calderihabitans maritimus]